MTIRKKILALLMSLAVVLTYMPELAFAYVTDAAADREPAAAEETLSKEQPEEATDPPVKLDDQAEETAGAVSDQVFLQKPVTADISVDLGDSDDLIMQFLNKHVSEQLGVPDSPAGMRKAARATRGSKLEGNEAIMYEALIPKIQAIADGTSSTSVISLPISVLVGDDFILLAEELGLETLLDENGKESVEAKEALKGALNFNINLVLDALLADFPYEFYWFDKTKTGIFRYRYVNGSYSCNDDRYVLSPNFVIQFELGVSADYSQSGETGTTDVDTSKTDRASSFVTNAVSLINNNSDKSDLEKLETYKAAICANTTYDDNAAAGNVDYGDPWQMISVFDDDKETNVVCEGYSKAFQFLCDHTTFKSIIIECDSVTGLMDGGKGAGRHMWNILHMDDGKNYIADITNCDDGTVGKPDKLFLKGATSGNVADGYSFVIDRLKTIDYTYDSSTRGIFSDFELTLSETDYEPPIHTHALIKTETAPATCESDGTEAYWTCSDPDCGKMFADNSGSESITEPVVIPALGHLWGEPAYTWAEDNSKVTGTVVCLRDPSHVESETVRTSSVRTEPTETENGREVFTSEAFKNTLLKVQTKEVELPATGSGDPIPTGLEWSYKGDQSYVRGIIGESLILGDDFFYEGNTLKIIYDNGQTEEIYICKDVPDGGGVYVGYYLNGDTSGGVDTDLGTQGLIEEVVLNESGKFTKGQNQVEIKVVINGYEISTEPFIAIGVEDQYPDNPDNINILIDNAEAAINNAKGQDSAAAAQAANAEAEADKPVPNESVINGAVKFAEAAYAAAKDAAAAAEEAKIAADAALAEDPYNPEKQAEAAQAATLVRTIKAVVASSSKSKASAKAAAAKVAMNKADAAKSTASSAEKGSQEAVDLAQASKDAAEAAKEAAAEAKTAAQEAMDAAVDAGYTKDSDEYKAAEAALYAANEAFSRADAASKAADEALETAKNDKKVADDAAAAQQKAAADKAAAEKAAADRAAAEYAANGCGYIDPNLPKVKIKAPKKAKKSFTAKWKKLSKKQQKIVKGIEIEYSTTPDFSTAFKFKSTGKKKDNIKIKGLVSKKTYYVRAHTYVIRNGIKYVSYWSATKKVKVK